MSRQSLQPGELLSDFRIKKNIEIEELNLALIQLEHEPTAARWVHLQNSDPNNLFAVGFRTPPDDSTGIAHILEHTVLCGSRRYPVRDPFFSMLKRSLNTFMNAMTANDWTLYPFSTQNRKDFSNLLDIYLDAAFFPLLRENDFLQEGHRLEFENHTDPGSRLEYRGVVYNEMKGAMASPSSLLYRRLGKALYPSTCYRFNSGGEPAEIPDLTWKNLRDFHRRYYHPSNAWFYSYGNMPLEAHLEQVSEKVLTRFSLLDIDSSVPPEQSLMTPRYLTENYPLDPGEDPDNRAMVQTAWLTCDIENSLDRLSLNLLSMLLLGNPGAPLYKSLLDSKLGGNLAPGSGYQDDNRTTYFCAGLQSTESDRSSDIENLILKTLADCARDGFRRERIEGVIHRLEFSQREVSGDRYPYSLGLLMKILGPWLHADDPVSVLKLDDLLGQLRDKASDPDYFPALIDRYLLNNRHRVTLTLAPDSEMQARIERETKTRLAALAEQMTPDEKQEIIRKSVELKKIQEEQEDTSCLPTLELSDIPEKEIAVPSKKSTVAQTGIEWFEQPTNGIGYFSAYLPVAGLPAALVPYLPIYCSLSTQIGAAGRSYTEMAELVEAYTGGIHLGMEILDDPDRPERFEALLNVRGKALAENQEDLYGLIGDYLVAPDFTDIDRIRTVLKQMVTSFENSIPGSGHLYAARAGAAHLSSAAKLREQWSGITLLHLLRQLARMSDEELKKESANFKDIRDFLVNRTAMECAVSGEKDCLDKAENKIRRLLDRLPENGPRANAEDQSPKMTRGRFGWATSVPVSYVTRTYRTVPYTHPDSAALLVLSKLLRSGYLHREIREKGGAYGGLASCNVESGFFSLLSYRDPHIARTLKVYEDAVAWAAAGTFDDEAIKEAKLSVFADLDRPLSPGSRGNHEFANNRQGLNREKRQDLRQRVLEASRDTLTRAARIYLAENRDLVDSVISSEERLEQEFGEISGKEQPVINRI